MSLELLKMPPIMLRSLLFLTILYSVAYARVGYNDLIPNGYKVPCPTDSIGCDTFCIALGHNTTDATTGKVVQECSSNNTVVAARSSGINAFGRLYVTTGWNSDWCKKDGDGDGLYDGQELGDYLCLWTVNNDIAVPSTHLSHPGDATAFDAAVLNKGCYKNPNYPTINGTAPDVPSVSVIPSPTSALLTINLPGPTAVCAYQYIINYHYNLTNSTSLTDSDGNVTTTNSTYTVTGDSSTQTVTSYNNIQYAIPNLPLQTLIYFSVVASNDWGQSISYNGSFTTLKASAPGKITFQVSEVNANTVTLSWSTPAETGGLFTSDGLPNFNYAIYVMNSTANYTVTVPFANVTENVYELVNLTYARTYHVRMRGCNSLGCGTYSSWLTFSTSVTGAAALMAPPIIIIASIIFLFFEKCRSDLGAIETMVTGWSSFLHKRSLLLLSILYSVAYARVGYNDLIPNGYKVPCPTDSIGCDTFCIALGHNTTDATTGKVVQECSSNNTVVEARSSGINAFGRLFVTTGWNSDWCKKDGDGDGLYDGQELGDYLCLWTVNNDIAVPSTHLSHPGDATAYDPAVLNKGCYKNPNYPSVIGGYIIKDVLFHTEIIRLILIPRSESPCPVQLQVCAYNFIINYHYNVTNSTSSTDSNGSYTVTGRSSTQTVTSYNNIQYAIPNLPLQTLIYFSLVASNDWGQSISYNSSFNTPTASSLPSTTYTSTSSQLTSPTSVPGAASLMAPSLLITSAIFILFSKW
ncbi:hypothetical protein PROFUN_13385 [Planoprotostelium fungivorum]|uniref:Fibronectin type-III domain-containing protein n=1 Tax=Planoprotostelium fungivorum TaxID=1890364 RepID=A0A2P6MZQ5_9EUKA|nr:hypothetical protein PROFUN_13385 [Planoprotostelium fungivorum]